MWLRLSCGFLRPGLFNRQGHTLDVVSILAGDEVPVQVHRLGRNDASGVADLEVPDDDLPAAISDAGWAELNRKFNELLMGRSG